MFYFIISMYATLVPVAFPHYLVANEDVVDGDVNELDEETNEAHDGKADSGGLGNGREFLPVGLGALLHQVHGILGKLPEGLDDVLLESFFASHLLKLILYKIYQPTDFHNATKQYVLYPPRPDRIASDTDTEAERKVEGQSRPNYVSAINDQTPDQRKSPIQLSSRAAARGQRWVNFCELKKETQDTTQKKTHPTAAVPVPTPTLYLKMREIPNLINPLEPGKNAIPVWMRPTADRRPSSRTLPAWRVWSGETHMCADRREIIPPAHILPSFACANKSEQISISPGVLPAIHPPA